VRLVRQGDTFTSYASDTNGNWQLLGSRTISMSSTIFVGLATSSHNDGVLGTVVYDDVQVLGGSSGGNTGPTAIASGAPLTGDVPLEVQFTGDASTDDVGVVSYSWDFGNGDTSEEANPLYTYATQGSYTATLTVLDAEGLSSSDTVEIEVIDPLAVCDPVPDPWINSDIGPVGAAGNACFDGSAFEIEASGADIWGSRDEFHFVYQSLTGDGEIIARVVSQENTDAWAKAGVMMRESLDANSAMIYMTMSPDPLGIGPAYTMGDRPAAGVAMTAAANNVGPVSSGGYPHYVRLVRQGDTFTSYASDTNGNWQLLGSRTISMSITIFVGLATSSHNDGVLGKVVYDDVQIIESASAAKSTISTLQKMTLSPNPTSESINMEFEESSEARLIQIFDLQGRLVKQKFVSAGQDIYEIEVYNLPVGTYIVRSSDDKGRLSQEKMVIKR